ncbi:MAG: hypothetical protein M1547_05080, partial [Gammaproteobacteria bacterium]|nr:hypothetical protein [Gammaproteobacteria bacterium]
KNAEECDVAAALEAFLAQHYIGRTVPPLIIVSQTVDDSLLAAPTVRMNSHLQRTYSRFKLTDNEHCTPRRSGAWHKTC